MSTIEGNVRTYSEYDTGFLDSLVGHKIVATEWPALILDDGTRVEFDTEDHDCCSWIELTGLAATDNIITAASFGDNEDETGGEGDYKAWLHVVTEAGELNVAEANGDASNGYYLHGFALGIKVISPV